MELFQNISGETIHHYQFIGLLIALSSIAVLVYLLYSHPKENRVIKKRVAKRTKKDIYKPVYQTTDVLLQDRNILSDNFTPFYPVVTNLSISAKIFAFIMVLFILFIPLYKILHIQPLVSFFHSCLI